VAQHKSAIKRIRRNDRARVRNRHYLAAVKTAVKKFRTAVLGAGQGTFDKAAVRPLFVNAQAMLAKAGAKGILHKNNVARKIGRLSAMLKSAEAGVVAAADLKIQKKSAAVRRQEAAAKEPVAAAKPAKAAPAAKTKAKAAPAAKGKKAAPAKKPPAKKK
jgi:small subunit ribosomal protein S20